MRPALIAATAVGVVMGTVSGTAPALAAPSQGPSPQETIAGLRADGHRVVVNKIGNAPLDDCAVTSVGRVITLPQRFGGPPPWIAVPHAPPVTTVHVAVNC